MFTFYQDTYDTYDNNNIGTHNSDNILDEEYKTNIGTHLKKLMEKRDDAKQSGDEIRLDEIQKEIDEINKFYAPAIGFGRKSRKFSKEDEKARISVKKSIDRACGKIKGKCPLLAQHFQICIKKGYFCSYSPNPEIKWNH
jgi:hypothetical protein